MNRLEREIRGKASWRGRTDLGKSEGIAWPSSIRDEQRGGEENAWQELAFCWNVGATGVSREQVHSAVGNAEIARAIMEMLVRPDPEVALLKESVKTLSERMKSLEMLIQEVFGGGGGDLYEEPMERWLREHPGDRKKYEGKHFAFQEGVGIVAEGDTLNEVYERVKAEGLLEKVDFGRVAVGNC